MSEAVLDLVSSRAIGTMDEKDCGKSPGQEIFIHKRPRDHAYTMYFTLKNPLSIIGQYSGNTMKLRYSFHTECM